MKKITVLIWALSVSLCSLNAQNFRVNMDAGYSVNNGAILGAGASYNLKTIGISAGFQTHTSSLVKLGAFLNLGIFKDLALGETWHILPGAAFSYHYKSGDEKGLNSPHPLYSIEIQKEILPDEMRIGIYGAYTGEYRLISIRLTGIF